MGGAELTEVQKQTTESALRCAASYLAEAAACLAAAGRFVDIAEDPLEMRKALSTGYASIDAFCLAIRNHLNLALDPPSCAEPAGIYAPESA